jgi:Na+/proline symporter
VAAVGGVEALQAKLAAMQAAAGPGAASVTAFFPDFSRGWTTEALWTLPALTFLVNIGLQWWAAWYPGAEPGGGGYIAQRIFSAKDERHGLLAVLWFNIAHYAVRPWPWIFTALCAVVLYPGLKQPETGYMLIAADHLPQAFRGILVAGFVAAFMSTFATQLNWGSSYIVSDFYRRFIRRNAAEPHYVNVGRLVTILLVVTSGYVSWLLSSIGAGWLFVLEVGAGTGLVYILRWYWWRINAWSEISAMATALVVSVGLRVAEPFAGSGPVVFAKSALTTTAITTVVWVIVTLLTPPEPRDTLLSFYRKVRPHASGWQPVAADAPEVPQTRDLGRNLLNWVLGCAMVYSALFGVGKLCFKDYSSAAVLLMVAVASGALIYREISKLGSQEVMKS